MDDYICIFDNVFNDTSKIASLYDYLLAEPDLNYFCEKDKILNFNEGEEYFNHSSVFKHIWDKHASHFDTNKKTLYFEMWYNHSHGAYHVDKDEGHYDLNNEIISPIFSSVFFLGPSEPISGGDLYINTLGMSALDEFERPKTKHNILNVDGPEWVKIDFRYNRLVVFDPRYPHVVSPIICENEKLPRTSIALNPWDKPLVEGTPYGYFNK